MRLSAPQHRCKVSRLTRARLRAENRCFRNTGGVSQNNCDHGFRPAFLDSTTGQVYPSRFGDGAPAPVHILDGLPDHLVLQRTPEGRVAAVKHTVVSGFLWAEHFYTREQAAELLARLDRRSLRSPYRRRYMSRYGIAR